MQDVLAPLMEALLRLEGGGGGETGLQQISLHLETSVGVVVAHAAEVAEMGARAQGSGSLSPDQVEETEGQHVVSAAAAAERRRSSSKSPSAMAMDLAEICLATEQFAKVGVGKLESVTAFHGNKTVVFRSISPFILVFVGGPKLDSTRILRRVVPIFEDVLQPVILSLSRKE